jgi:glycerol-3-phosphate dehydrogenase
MHDSFDVAIIGGGVLGTAAAARLSQTTARICLIEQENDIAEGASKGNAGIATCFYGSPGTLESRLIAASSPRWEDICGRLDVPFRRLGLLNMALHEDEVARLPELATLIQKYGAPAELVSSAEAKTLEPLITPRCLGAVYQPTEAIIDPMRLTFGYAELAAQNGVDVRLSTRVIGFEKHDGRIVAMQTTRGVVHADYIINAAGLFADEISSLADGTRFKMWPRPGQYWVLDREIGLTLRRIVRGLPGHLTLGIQVSPTTNGSVILGPTAQDSDDRFDKSTDKETLARLYENARALVPSISLDYAIKSYTGVRPASEKPFRAEFDEQVPNLIHIGSRSNGVSASPALADYVLDLLGQSGLQFKERKSASNALPAVPRLLLDPEPERLPATDPLYAQVVCACEQVTAAEIVAALKARVPARSIEGIRKRTRATGGRCQGSVCMVGVAFLCSLHTGYPPEDVPYGSNGGHLGVGHVEA